MCNMKRMWKDFPLCADAMKTDLTVHVISIIEILLLILYTPCRDGVVVNVSSSRAVGCEFAPRACHTKDHHENGTNCLPAWHAGIMVGGC